MRTVTCHLPPIGSVARHSTQLASRQWPPNLDILVHAYERCHSIWKSDKTMFFKPGLGHLSGPRDLVWGTSLPSSVTHQHSSPCKLHCISMYSPDELQRGRYLPALGGVAKKSTCCCWHGVSGFPGSKGQFNGGVGDFSRGKCIMYCCSEMSNDSKSCFKGCTVKNITLQREKALMKLKNAVINDIT